MMNKAVIVAYGRTPCCRAKKGGLADMHPIDFAAQALRGVLEKVPQLNPTEIDDVITGCAMPFRELNLNASRLIVNRAGLPDEVPAQTINRFCSSGLQAIATAANAIAAGQYTVAVAGGVEGMTSTFGKINPEHYNQWLVENYPGAYMSMGETAENVARHYEISRTEMEEMALGSHRKAAAARKNRKLAPSIIPVVKADGTVLTEDDGILADAEGNLLTSLEKMAEMKPCFVPEECGGSVTAATSSQTTDAAAYVVLMSAKRAEELGIKPIAYLKGYSVSGCDPTEMGLGPIYAVRKVMKMTGLTVEDMDVIEINEAFASQSLACIRELGMPMEKVNPYGGAMALGHPMGATGAFLTGKVLDYLRDEETAGKYGLVTMCIGGGQGAAAVFEIFG